MDEDLFYEVLGRRRDLDVVWKGVVEVADALVGVFDVLLWSFKWWLADEKSISKIKY